ncbi:MAG: beta-eliminating lyase-related protein [Xanthomonadales bacterium]|nr:beta-eliminating lyase-related protein [Xanthomonadales bacterium]
MDLNFRSDNESPAAAEILAALSAANQGYVWSYAEDDWSNRLDSAFSELFGTDVAVLPVSTGTAANSIALSCLAPAWGSVYCHTGAHIVQDEGGAPEFFGHGIRLVGVVGEQGKLQADPLRRSIASNGGHGVHSYLPSALSLTQSTEAGTIYQPAEVAELCGAAAEFGLPVHMDGARFANAIAALGCSPGESTWQAGVRMLSFGASKNGCFAAEALLMFGDSALMDHAERMRKRSGHLLSKMRFVSAQLLAYIEDGLWLRLAGHANAQAARFAAAIEQHPKASLEFPVEANEVFVRWSKAGFEQLEAAGVQFLIWPGHDDMARFVFSHCGSAEGTERLCEIVAGI